ADTVWGKVPVPPGAPQGTQRLLVRPAGVRLTDVRDGLPCTVEARTFRGDHVALMLRPGDGPRLEAACALRDAPEAGARVGVAFDADEVVVLSAP
ncbi:iron ABC transporter ATP-binding protein, partial [Streptomyces varsoviensis]